MKNLMVMALRISIKKAPTSGTIRNAFADRPNLDVSAFILAIATGVALAVIAGAAPVLGALADYRPFKKRFLGGFAFLGAASSAALFFVFPGDWLLALILLGLANIGASGSVIFYDALLPHLAKRNEVDRLSTAGFALGYLGGGLALGLSLYCIKSPEKIEARLPVMLVNTGIENKRSNSSTASPPPCKAASRATVSTDTSTSKNFISTTTAGAEDKGRKRTV